MDMSKTQLFNDMCPFRLCYDLRAWYKIIENNRVRYNHDPSTFVYAVKTNKTWPMKFDQMEKK